MRMSPKVQSPRLQSRSGDEAGSSVERAGAPPDCVSRKAGREVFVADVREVMLSTPRSEWYELSRRTLQSNLRARSGIGLVELINRLANAVCPPVREFYCPRLVAC